MQVSKVYTQRETKVSVPLHSNLVNEAVCHYQTMFQTVLQRQCFP